MEGFTAAVRLLPPALLAAAQALPEAEARSCEELRLRRGRPMTALLGRGERALSDRPVSEADLRHVLEAATRSSLHAAEEQLGRGFLSAPGGVRVGVCGAAAGEGLRAFSSLALRVPRQVRGCAGPLWPAIRAAHLPSLLLISPPGAGKTTLLRELSRLYSEAGLRVAMADERGELADAWSGLPGFDVGPHTDVMTGVEKARAALMLIRAMRPEVLALDELTDEADAAALRRAVGCGTRILATVHGTGRRDVERRPACRALLEDGAFAGLVTIEVRDGARSYRMEAL